MPTVTQIDAAKSQLNPNPYTASSKLKDDAVQDLYIFLKRYLSRIGQGQHYAAIPVKLAAAEGREAAQLQAVLNNVSGVGSKVATLDDKIKYSTEENIAAELEFALSVMYDRISNTSAATGESCMAERVRNAEYPLGEWVNTRL